tara:strand:+ start:2018 stop:2161 length:144 start_codon:yes stop_codon:yes gene_type:complete
MAEVTIEVRVKKTAWFYLLYPVWIIQTMLGSNYHFLIDKAYKAEVVE